jgi:TonB family protein
MRHVDILDERDSLKRPFTASLVLHGGVCALAVALTAANFTKTERWGDPSAAGGGSVGVSAVRSIPIPGRSGPINRVANDTKSQVPDQAKPEPKRTVKEDPDAIGLKFKKNQKPAERNRFASNRRDLQEQAPNQLTSRGGAAATSPVFGMPASGSGVGVGTGMPFGTRFGAYAMLIRERVSQKWRTESVDPRLRTLPPAIVTFDILRNGTVRNIRVIQTSGNYALDVSAQRAITDAAPFEPLPAQYEGSVATIEFWFNLKR